jgi:hypothetical protein
VETLVALAQREKLLNVLAAGSVAASLSLLAGAWRLLPIYEYLRYYPRPQFGDDRLSLGELLQVLVAVAPDSNVMAPFGSHPWNWVEYSSFVGWVALGLALFGAFVAARRQRGWLFGLLVFALLGMGSFAARAPWSLLHSLPIYDSLKVPSRLIGLALLYLALLAGLGLEGIVAFVARRFRWPTPGLLGAVACAALMSSTLVPVLANHYRVLAGRWDEKSVTPSFPVQQRFFIVHVTRPYSPRGHYPPPAHFPEANLGEGACYTGMEFPPAPGLWSGASPQARIEGEGSLLDWGSSTRRIWAEVELRRPGSVVFNQSYGPGWQVNTGRLASLLGLISVDLPRGRHRVELEFAPVSLPWAFGATLLGLSLMVALALAGPRIVSRSSSSRLATLTVLSAIVLAMTLGATRLVLRLAKEQAWPVAMVVAASASDWDERGLNDLYRPEKAIDGDATTDWILPNQAPGWLDLRLRQATPLFAIQLVNALNAPYFDRGAKDLEIEGYRGQRRVYALPASFKAPQREPDLMTLELPAQPVDRVRIVVKSWFGLSGGLGTVRVIGPS